MIKLRAPVSVASWLLVALAVIVCQCHSFSSAVDVCKAMNMLGCGHEVSVEDRPTEQWKKLASSALEEIKKRDSYGEVSDNAKHWLETLTAISHETDCDYRMAAKLISWRPTVKKLKKFDTILSEYLELYLRECGMEEQFKIAIGALKQVSPESWSSGEYATLYGFIRGRRWSAKEASDLLLIVKDIAKLISNPEKTDCTDKHLIGLISGRIFGGEGDVRQFLDGYGRLFLDKCGFEKRLAKAIDTLGQVSPTRLKNQYEHETMYKILKNKNWSCEGAEWLLSIVDDILRSAGNPKKTNCSDRYLTDLVMKRVPRITSSYGAFLSDYTAYYLEECGFEELFKKAIDELKQVQLEHWTSDRYKTLHAYFESRSWSQNDLEKFLLIVRDISELGNISKETNCTDLEFHAVSLKHYFATTTSLDEFSDGHYEVYFTKCGFEERFKKAIVNIGQVSSERWNSNEFPTLSSYLGEREFYFKLDKNGAFRLLSAIREISKPDSITDGIDCSKEHVAQFAEWFLEVWYYRDLFKLLSGYSAFVLKQCGFEQRFQKAIDNSKKFPNVKHLDSIKYSTLSSYLTAKPLVPSKIVSLLSLIEEISDLEYTSAEIDCTDEHETEILELLVTISNPDIIYELLDGYLAFCMDKCGFNDQFMGVLGNIENFSPGLGPRIYQNLSSYFKQSHTNIQAIKEPISIIRGLADLGNISEDIDCSDKLKTDLLVLLDRSKPYPKVKIFVDTYFNAFLDKCGHEENFKKAFDNIKRLWPHHSDYPDTIPTLGSYLSEHRYMNQSACLEVLSVVKELSALENFSKQTHCNDELLTKLLEWNSRNDKTGYYRILSKDYFAFYLNECGFEQIFQKLSDNKTLFSLLWGKRRRKSWPEQVMSTVKELNYLKEATGETGCSRKLIENFLELHHKRKQDNPELHTVLEGTLTGYIDKCGLTDLGATVQEAKSKD